MAIRGFRTKIAFHVVLLVFLSALIADVLAVLVLQGFVVRHRLDQHSALLESAARLVLHGLEQPIDAADSEIPRQLPEILANDDFSAIAIVDRSGTLRFEKGHPDHSPERIRRAVDSALHTGKPCREALGLMWAVFWWSASDELVAVPLHGGETVSGAAAAVVPLAPLYAKVSQYNKPVLYYILLNSIILSAVGLYRIFRIYLHPIDRIVRQADEYSSDEDLFFTFRREDDELNRLSSALNRMLKRIAEDQQKLKASVVSLAKANQELKEAQNEIVRAEKMASVGRLAAGIAHEIGNPIGIVLGYMELIRQPDLAPEELKDFSLRAEKEIQRINTIIRQLLDLARPKKSEPQELSVHAVLEEIAGVMGTQPLMSGIEIDLKLEAEHDILMANAEQLRQVFLNLLLNAGDAIADVHESTQGRIGIRTWNEIPPSSHRVLGIRFEDNGKGISPDQIDSVFDPFYTTKEPGKGTGLGLAVSYMIIQKMGGTISVESRENSGTQFTIFLPLETIGAAPQLRDGDSQTR